MFISFPGKIHLITKNSELDFVLKTLSSENFVGFDTETKPSFKKGDVFKVALLQLATETDAFLIRLHSIDQFEQIKNILESISITKIGVAIRDDIKLLQKTFPFTPGEFVELQDLARKKGLKNFGLKGMTEELLLTNLSKGPKMTNWEAHELSDNQMLYAATDAWIGLKLFQKMNEIVVGS